MLAFASRSRRLQSALVNLMEGDRLKFAITTLLSSLRSGVKGLVFEIDVHSPPILGERDDLHWGD
jgi:hypothetical protein